MQFNHGKSYLNKQEKDRLDKAFEYRKFYESSFETLRIAYLDAGQRVKEDHDKWLQIAVLMPRLISKVSADFLFLEPPDITCGNEKAQAIINEIYNAKFKQRLYMAAISQSIYGGVTIKLLVDETALGGVKASFIPQYQYYPEYYIFTDDLSGETLAIEEPADNENENYLLIEKYTPGMLASSLYKIDAKLKIIKGDLSLDMINRPPEEPTIEGITPLFYVPLIQESPKDYGLSDYDGLETLFFALNRRLTHNEHGLEVHGGAKLAAPSELFDEFGRPIKPNFEYWAVPSAGYSGQSPLIPQYIQQQLSVEENIATIQEYIKLIFLCTEISPDVFGLGEGAAESGRALRMRLLRTLTMVRRKASIWSEALKSFFETALMVNNMQEPVNIQFQDGLPTDWDELIDQEIRKVTAGIQSKQDAIKAIDESNDEAALAKLGQINVEQETYNKSFNAGFSI